MPPVPALSPATGKPTSAAFIHTLHSSFLDKHGRTLLLRGVNLAGASKAPVGCPSHIRDQFWERAEAGTESFIGRPLNLDGGTADVHLARLRGWGFNVLRFPVTWEALEHEGPGKYDDEFIDYTIRVLRKCKQHGFRVYMDPHQDVWSRFSGGSGAPFWTLPACGINHRHITPTKAALLHCEYPSPSDPDPASFPAMIWSTNYGRLFSQTLFTLFWAGRSFAPKCLIDGTNIQDYLQSHFIGAFGHLADRIRAAGDLFDDCIIGWDPMNEPSEGLIQWEDLNLTPKAQGNTLKKGPSPTPAQGLRLGMGQAQTVENWTFGTFGPSKSGNVNVDPEGLKLWADADFLNESSDGLNARWGWKRDPGWELGTCIWAQHGVWDIETGYILRPDYFKFFPQGPSIGLPVEFFSDFWVPHFTQYTKRIRTAHPEAILFVQPPVFAPPPKADLLSEDVLRGRSAYSPHYYDGLTLITKHWNWFNADALGLLRGKYSSSLAALKVGTKAIRTSFRDQFTFFKQDALTIGHGGYPTMLGEIGTPFDMDNKRSYGWTDEGRYTGDYERQEAALDASLNGADGDNVFSVTMWNYCPDAGWEWGDGWNGEDLALWTEDDLKDDLLFTQPKGDDRQSVYSGIARADSQVALLHKRGSRRFDSGAQTPLLMATRGSSVSLANPNPTTRQPLPQASPSIPFVSPFTTPQLPSLATPQLPPLAPTLNIPSFTPRQRVGYTPHLSPFDFLTNGARAWKAFSRPYPLAVVGRVADLQFAIRGKGWGEKDKAPVFKCTIRVGRGDRAASGNADADGGVLPTEIFLPLVHFGSDSCVVEGMESLGDADAAATDGNGDSDADTDGGVVMGKQKQNKARKGGVMTDEDSDSRIAQTQPCDDIMPPSSGDVQTSPGDGISSSRSSTLTKDKDILNSTNNTGNENDSNDDTQNGSGYEALQASTSHMTTTSTMATSTTLAPAPPPHDLSEISIYPPGTSDLLDIEVSISEGTWRVRGQVLEWSYDTPLGEKEKEVRIQVRRRGGPLDPDRVRKKDHEPGEDGDGDGGLCHRICCACVVM